jgi:DNA transformation protein and related proteins
VRDKTRVDARGALPNLGPVSTKWLAAVDIHTLGDLRRVGVVNAYNLVRAQGYNASLNLLWALQGAMTNTPWNALPGSIKQELKRRIKESA